MRKADLYIRVSTDEQADKGYSQRDQEDRLRRYCELKCRFRFMVSPLSDLRYPPIQIHGIPPCFMLKGIW